jgi:hypothetical protein
VLIIGLFDICNSVDTVVNGPVINESPMGTKTLIEIFLALSKKVYYSISPKVLNSIFLL